MLGWPPDWSAPTQSQLWRYHLHYFDILIDLVLSNGQPGTAEELIASWIAANPMHGAGVTHDAWHPYVASVRTVNWMVALSASGVAEAVPAAIRDSLAQHALFIERNLETDVGGNHLLKNLKAMVFAGYFWEGAGAETWRRQFSRDFVTELERQILPDGGHYERSPMYHCQVMSDAMEIATVIGDRDEAPFKQLTALISRMDQFLITVTHPDGDIALVNDSAFGMVPSPRELHRQAASFAESAPARTDSNTQALSSGYLTLPSNDPDRYLLADVGAVCPDDLPAHAHADLLSFELSVGGRRMIVDSGVGEYAAGPWRDYYRSTRAHNTVMVDGIEQSDCWGSFRVGRRAYPANVSFRREGPSSILEAEHTGYDDLAGVRHRRQFIWSDDGFWVIADALAGRGAHRWVSFCHLHPDVAVIAEGPSWLRIARDSSVLDIAWYGFAAFRRLHGERDELQGWYADRFGPPRAATVLLFEGHGPVPAAFGYALIPRTSVDAGPPVWSMPDIDR